MRLKEFKFIVETTAETQDILKLSNQIIDFIYMEKDKAVPGAILIPSKIPGISASTPAGQTVLDATRIKLVDASVFKTPNTRADAAPYYTSDKGRYGDVAYKDARTSREFNKGRMPGMSVADNPEFTDLISHEASKGNRLDIRIRIDLLDDLERATSTLAHEFTHHLDTIKGRNNSATYDADIEAKKAQERLDLHNRIKKSWGAPGSHPGFPDPDGLLDPKEEKRLIGIVKRAPKALPSGMGKAYLAEVSELNARLTQAAYTLAERLPSINFILDSADQINLQIKKLFREHAITVCFVNFPSEEEFISVARGDRALTPAELKEAYANPEFQQLYKRMYKFFESEAGKGGLLAKAQADRFKNWNTTAQAIGDRAAQASKTPKAAFIERFIQQVIKGAEAVKDVAKLALRHVADSELTRILARELPKMLAKGVLKSIPYVGALIGLVFGIERLIKGDVPGAGLEVVGGVGSLATAIPATAYQASRDLYGEYYEYDSGKPAILEYDMANDPEGTQQRVSELAQKIEQDLKDGLTRNQGRLTGKQAAANQRSAIRNIDTPGNPSPALHPELYPQNESLTRIVELAVVKKPT